MLGSTSARSPAKSVGSSSNCLGFGFRVWGLGFRMLRFLGLGFRVWGLGFRVWKREKVVSVVVVAATTMALVRLLLAAVVMASGSNARTLKPLNPKRP